MKGIKQAYDKNRDYAIRSRRTVFQREMDSLKTLMHGGCVHVWPYMQDFWGDYSEEQTINFVHQILEEETYRRKHAYNYEAHAHKLPFYRNMLYCVLRTLTSGYTEYENGNKIGLEAPQEVTFSTVLSSFGDTSGEILDYTVVHFMEELYKIFTQKTIDLFLLIPELEPDWQDWELREEMMKQEAEIGSDMEDELGPDMKAIREAEREELEYLKHLEQKRIEEEERLDREFADKEHFCKSLEEILQYQKENPIEGTEMKAEMEELIFQFLSDRNLSIFDNEEAYVEVMVQLKRTIRTAKAYREEG